MTTLKALASANPGMSAVRVRTKSGAEYNVPRDAIEGCDSDDDWVYGYRCNSVDACGPFRKVQPNGTIRWFAVRNVTIVTP